MSGILVSPLHLSDPGAGQGQATRRAGLREMFPVGIQSVIIAATGPTMSTSMSIHLGFLLPPLLHHPPIWQEKRRQLSPQSHPQPHPQYRPPFRLRFHLQPHQRSRPQDHPQFRLWLRPRRHPHLLPGSPLCNHPWPSPCLPGLPHRLTSILSSFPFPISTYILQPAARREKGALSTAPLREASLLSPSPHIPSRAIR